MFLRVDELYKYSTASEIRRVDRRAPGGRFRVDQGFLKFYLLQTKK